jgi:hypothetical protein
VAALLAFASCSAGDEESLLQSADPASGTGETATTIGATTGVEPSRLAPEATQTTQTTQIGNGDDREAAGASPEASSSTTAPTSAGEALPATETTTTAAVQTTTAPLSPLYLVDTYDPGRDPAADLDNALRVARAEDRLVILIVGGDWCPDCFTLDAFIAGDTERASRLQSEAALVKVNISAENETQAFLSTFPAFRPHCRRQR